MVKRTSKGTCPQCRESNAGGKYIYPIPEGFLEEIRRDPNAGAKVCSSCAPEIIEAQIDQGLMMPVAIKISGRSR